MENEQNEILSKRHQQFLLLLLLKRRMHLNRMLAIMQVYVLYNNKIPREFLKRNRTNFYEWQWDQIRQKDWNRQMRMPPETFQKLVNMIRPELMKDRAQSNRRNGHICPETRLAICIAISMGASYLQTKQIFGVGRSTMYTIFWDTILAIANNEELSNVASFPQTMQECSDTARVSTINATTHQNTTIGNFVVVALTDL